MFKQRGEIATFLTLVSVGLMLAGIVVGNVAVQQTTRTQSKATDTCYPTKQNCIGTEPNCQDCTFFDDCASGGSPGWQCTKYTWNWCQNKKYGEYIGTDDTKGPQGCQCDEANKIYVRWRMNCGGSCDVSTGANCPNTYPQEDSACQAILKNAGTTCNFASGGRCHKDITTTNCDEISADPNNCPTGYDPGPCSVNPALIPTTYNICMGKKVGEYLGVDASVGPQGCKCDNDNKIYVRWHLNCGGTCNLTTGVNCPNRYPQEDPLCKRILESAGTPCNFASLPDCPSGKCKTTGCNPDTETTDTSKSCVSQGGGNCCVPKTAPPAGTGKCYKCKDKATDTCSEASLGVGETCDNSRGYYDSCQLCSTTSTATKKKQGESCGGGAGTCGPASSCTNGTAGLTASLECEGYLQCCSNTAGEVTDSQGNKCSASRIDVNGLCNFACCGVNSDCPTGEECGIPNGYCKNSQKSCGAKAPNQSEVLYVRMCGGGGGYGCSWTYCDGLNVDINKCVNKKQVDYLLGLSRPVTKDDKGILCLSNDECKSFVPTAAPGVNKCRLTGQATFAEAKQVDCPTTYPQCYSEGKAVIVHRDCSQTNESGCIYWCESKDGKRTGCGPADAPDAKTFDEPSCKSTAPEEPSVECSKRGGKCTKGKCPDDTEAKVISCEGSKYGDANELNCCVPKSSGSTSGSSSGTGTVSATCSLTNVANLSKDCTACILKKDNWASDGRLRNQINSYPGRSATGCSDDDLVKYWCSGKGMGDTEANSSAQYDCKNKYLDNECKNDCAGYTSNSSGGSTRTTTTNGGCTYRNAPTEVEAGKTFNLVVENPSQKGAANVGMVFKKGTTIETPQTGATADPNGEKWTFNNLKAPADAGDWKLSFGWRCSNAGCNNTCDPIDIKVKGTGTSTSTAPKCSSDVDNTADIKPACSDCIKKKIGESTLRTISECTTDNQKINKYCTKNIPTSIVQCSEFIAACSSDCSTSPKAGAFLVPQSYDNESYNAVIEAIKSNSMNAIAASVYVMNATRVPGLQRQYCDPFKGQCDFYYQQNPQKGT